MDEDRTQVAELERLFSRKRISRREFVAGLAAAGLVPATQPVLETPAAGNYVVLIVVDACRPSYLTLTSLPHINALIESGVTYEQAWSGAMESETPAVHATLGTGTLPKQNGFLGFGWVQPETREKVDFRTLLAEGKIDPILSQLRVPSVAARLQRSMPGAVAVAASGHKDYAVVGLGGGAATYQLYGAFAGDHFAPTHMHTKPPLTDGQRRSLTIKSPIPMGGEDSWAFQYVTDVVRKVRPRLLMVNVPEVDTWGHWYGPGNDAIFQKLLLNIDRGVGALQSTYQRLGLLEKTTFIITADHGMMTSYPIHGWTATVAAAARAEGTAIARADGTTGAIWLHDPVRAKGVAERLAASRYAYVNAIFYRSAPGTDYTYLQASPVNRLASPAVATALENLVATTAGKNGPDVWVIFRENHTASPRNVTGQWKGTHGGATWEAQHIPLIISGAGIRHGVQSQFPARSVDIAPTIEALLGLSPIDRDGVALADALNSPTTTQLAMQAAAESSLQADVHALQTQSLSDGLTSLLHFPEPPTKPWPGTPPVDMTKDTATCEC